MTTLMLRVEKYVEPDDEPPPEVPVRIYAVDRAGGRTGSGARVRRELVPISEVPAQSRELTVEPGRYYVEVVLPSGELLSDTVDVPATGRAVLVLRAERSPHEWLSWQHLVGNVSPVLPEGERRRPKMSKKAGATARRAAGRRLQRPEVVPPIAIAPDIAYLSTPPPALVGHGDAWELLAGLQGPSTALLPLLNSGQALYPIPLYARDESRAVYRVVLGPTSVSGATALEPALPRHFVVVTQPHRLELLSVPVPWAQIRTGRQAVVEVVVQQTRERSEFVSNIGVRDEQLVILLGFLSTGALSPVREIAESAKDLLYGKMQNSLAAAAGAYAMVGSATDTGGHAWHQWIRNLSEWFEHLPDGAIQRAQLLLRLRRSAADITAATKLLKDAYRRGLPYYTLGVRWLLDGLEKVGRLDPEAEQMSRAVRAVASRIHPLSPFTIVRLGDG
jgi:hypothetical protein